MTGVHVGQNVSTELSGETFQPSDETSQSSDNRLHPRDLLSRFCFATFRTPRSFQATDTPFDPNSDADRRRWHIPSMMHPGDILLFNVKTIHAATVQSDNTTRFSLDVRVTTCPAAHRDVNAAGSRQ